MSAEKPVVLVTGSTDGIGLHTAKRLAAAGFRVIIHGRTVGRTDTAVAEVRRTVPTADVGYHTADLSTILGAHRLAEAVGGSETRLDCLINNAGVFQTDVEVIGKYDLTFAVNVAAPFVLSLRLLPLLRASARGCILNVSSISQNDFGRIDLGQLGRWTRTWDAYEVYSHSKAALAAFSYELALRLPGGSGGPVVLSCDPGTVNTKMLLAGWGPCGVDVADADDEFTLVKAAMSTGCERYHGKYYVRCRESRCCKDVYDDGVRSGLWSFLEEACALRWEDSAS